MGNTKLRAMVRGEEIMPTPEGNITGSEIWQVAEQIKEEDKELLDRLADEEKEELTEAEKCPCFYGGTCPTGGEHKDDL